MLIEISDELLKETRITEDDFKLNFACYLYEKRILTLEQSSKLAGLDQYQFQRILGDRKIEINYDLDDLLDDLETISKMN